jgi:hypothetical protein
MDEKGGQQANSLHSQPATTHLLLLLHAERLEFTSPALLVA